MPKIKTFVGGLGALFVMMVVSLTAVLGARAQARVPGAHKTITEYSGPQTCLTCHPDAGQEVAESLHYQQRGPAPFLDGWEEGKLAGMLVSF